MVELEKYRQPLFVKACSHEKLALLFALLLVLAACTPVAATPTAIASPAPPLTASLSSTATLTLTLTLEPPPVDPGFKNSANEATEPILENGTWSLDW